MSSVATVVIPTYNGEKYIADALASVFAQTVQPAEVILVDDASTDGTVQVAEHACKDAPVPVRIIKLSENSGGPTKPMNTGVSEAQTEVIVTLDQDDLMAPTRIESKVAVLQQNPEVPAVVGLLRKINAQGCAIDPEFESQSSIRILQIAHKNMGSYYLLEAESFYQHVVFVATLTIASSTAFRKSAWQAIGGFPESLRVAWDLDFSCKVAGLGPIAYLDSVIGSYRLHGANTSSQGLGGFREILQIQLEQLNHPKFALDVKMLRPLLADRYFGLGYSEATMGNTGRALRAYSAARMLGLSPSRTAIASLKAIAKGILKRAWN